MEKNKRQSFINGEFEKHFIFRVFLVLILALVCMGGGIYLLTKNSSLTVFENSRLIVKTTQSFFLPIILISSFVTLFLTSFFVWFFIYLFFHRIVGPLDRIKKYLKNIVSKGDFSGQFLLRSEDYIEDFAQSINNMTDSIKTPIADLHREILAMQEIEREMVELWRPQCDIPYKALERTIKKFKKQQRLLEEKISKFSI